MSSHIKTAYEYGIAEALKQAGYSSAAEFEKEALDLGKLRDLAARGASLGRFALPGAAIGSLAGAIRAGEDHRLEGALKGGLGAGLGSVLGASAGNALDRPDLAFSPDLGIGSRGLIGYGIGADLGAYLGGRMAQEEPSKLDKLRSRLGLDS